MFDETRGYEAFSGQRKPGGFQRQEMPGCCGAKPALRAAGGKDRTGPLQRSDPGNRQRGSKPEI